jgi:alkylation response protein AidB-like acyl-CoA dehydrogenase
MKDAGRRNSRETTLAKWHATVSSWEAADDAVQIHGAYGFSDEYPVERFLRNSRGGVIYEGTRELQELLQADFAMDIRGNPPSAVNSLPTTAPNGKPNKDWCWGE